MLALDAGEHERVRPIISWLAVSRKPTTTTGTFIHLWHVVTRTAVAARNNANLTVQFVQNKRLISFRHNPSQ